MQIFCKKVKKNLDNWKIILTFANRNKNKNDYENKNPTLSLPFIIRGHTPL